MNLKTKLTLAKETLRRLQEDESNSVNAGGLTKLRCNTTTDGVTCPTNHPVGCGGQANRHFWC